MTSMNTSLLSNLQSPQTPVVLRGPDLDRLIRSPIRAALLADYLVQGRSGIRELTDAQALRLTACDPHEFWRIRGLSAADRAAIEIEADDFRTITEWRRHRRALRKAAAAA
jgi:hypothetical protein